jgi:hypothetical protein
VAAVVFSGTESIAAFCMKRGKARGLSQKGHWYLVERFCSQSIAVQARALILKCLGVVGIIKFLIKYFTYLILIHTFESDLTT